MNSSFKDLNNNNFYKYDAKRQVFNNCSSSLVLRKKSIGFELFF